MAQVTDFISGHSEARMTHSNLVRRLDGSLEANSCGTGSMIVIKALGVVRLVSTTNGFHRTPFHRARSAERQSDKQCNAMLRKFFCQRAPPCTANATLLSTPLLSLTESPWSNLQSITGILTCDLSLVHLAPPSLFIVNTTVPALLETSAPMHVTY